MKKMPIIIPLIFLSFFGCFKAKDLPDSNSKTNKSVPKRISAKQAKTMMEEAAPYILLDVRTEAEFQEGHIKGAILIPDYELSSRAKNELLDKNGVILVYCRSGNRSRGAANLLAGMGYTNVYDFGGIINWPYEIIRK